MADWQKSKSCSVAFRETRRGCTIGDQLPGLPSTCYPPSSLCIVILSHCAAWTRNYPLPGQEDLNCHCWTLIWPMSPQHCNLNLIGTTTPISRLPLYHQLTDIICDVNSPPDSHSMLLWCYHILICCVKSRYIDTVKIYIWLPFLFPEQGGF